ncbi:Leucine-rich repeat-containing N-terminal, type 2 [Artemisia annua]|uniref:Leucine-rich repeat-containing N-terminal, type 2 n=1 Tax=Artemisia annua TaxID=35608 RepID=A0A2U1L7K8_ARTAN|nr:Leucine-rich repeat-containing N-terminal, type 2 [Artemisia annua]
MKETVLVTIGVLFFVQVHALIVFKEGIPFEPLMLLSSWNALDSDPCNWVGVSCLNDHLNKINSSGCSLEGFIAEEVSQLTFLHQLVLHDNNLIGPTPKEIGLLKHLNIMDLGRNQLSGPIPQEIGDLVSVLKINLQANAFTGKLPSELGNLKKLQELKVDRNKLQGTFPGANVTDLASAMRGMYVSNKNALGFCRTSPVKFADFSFIYFVGNIPKCLVYLPRTSFQGNCIKYKDITPHAPKQYGISPPAPNKPLKPTEEDTTHQPTESTQKPESEHLVWTSDEPYDDKREKEPSKVSENSGISEGIDHSSPGGSPADIHKDEVEHLDVSVDVNSEEEENATLDEKDKISEGDDDYYQEFNDMFHETIITPVVTPERLANMRTYTRHSSRKSVPPVKLSDYVLDGKVKYGIDKSVNYGLKIKFEGLELTRVEDEGLKLLSG